MREAEREKKWKHEEGDDLLETLKAMELKVSQEYLKKLKKKY